MAELELAAPFFSWSTCCKCLQVLPAMVENESGTIIFTGQAEAGLGITTLCT